MTRTGARPGGRLHPKTGFRLPSHRGALVAAPVANAGSPEHRSRRSPERRERR